MLIRVFDSFSQTGRAHLLLISSTPGLAGGALGVITLEDIIEVCSRGPFARLHC